MVKLVNLKEQIKRFYEAHYNIIHPCGKVLFTLAAMWFATMMFPYGALCNSWMVIVPVSLIAAVLPVPYTFFVSAGVAAWNLYGLSRELMAVYLVLFLLCWILFVRLDRKYAFIAVLTPILFFLKVEYILPVIVGMCIGLGGVLPLAGGSVMYFLGTSVKDFMAVSVTADSGETGLGAARLLANMISDKKMLIVIASLLLATFIIAMINLIFHERAWIFAVLIGNVIMGVMLLTGKMVFDIELEVWRVVLFTVIAIVVGILIQFFKGIGDITRMEKVSFEDDDYIYYVKAIPKIRLTKQERNVMEIKPEKAEEVEEPVEEPIEEVEEPIEEIEESVEEPAEEPIEEIEEPVEEPEEPAEEPDETEAFLETVEELKEEEIIDEC